MISEFKAAPTILALILLAAATRAPAQDSAPAAVAPGTITPGTISPGTINGTVVDQSGAVVAAAKITLIMKISPPVRTHFRPAMVNFLLPVSLPEHFI